MSITPKRVFAVDFHHPYSLLVNNTGCQQRPGDSGAPLIDDEGFIVALHYGSYLETKIPTGIANNFGCLCDTEELPLSERCEKKKSCVPYTKRNQRVELRHYSMNRMKITNEQDLLFLVKEVNGRKNWFSLEKNLCTTGEEKAELCEVEISTDSKGEIDPTKTMKQLCLDVSIETKNRGAYLTTKISDNALVKDLQSVSFHMPEKCQ